MELDKILPKDGPSIKEAEKYIDKYKNDYICIKVGGSVLNDKSLFKILLEDISILKKLNLNPILIHGGGKKLTNKLNELNIQTDFIDGLRITSQKVISIAEDVFIRFNRYLQTVQTNHFSFGIFALIAILIVFHNLEESRSSFDNIWSNPCQKAGF